MHDNPMKHFKHRVNMAKISFDELFKYEVNMVKSSFDEVFAMRNYRLSYGF